MYESYIKIPLENYLENIHFLSIFAILAPVLTLVRGKKDQYFEQNVAVQKNERGLVLEFSHLY